jgi:transposase InsO family protein
MVEQVQSKFDVSERRACEVVDQPRSSQRYEAKVRDDEAKLVTRMLELVRRFPRYGYRFITAKLRQDGWQVNAKRIYRLWRREGLKVPQKKRKKRRLGSSENSCDRRRAECANDVWCWDFIFDHTTSGSQLKWLSIVDEYTRECLCLKVGRSITSEDVLDTLAELFAMRGIPQHIRSDNGPEFVATAIQRWLRQTSIKALYVEPGSPWENGYAESFHSRFRDEFLALEEFESLAAARVLTATWRAEYNDFRPHSSLGYQTPSEFSSRCAASASVAALPTLQQHTAGDCPLPTTQPALS